MKIRNLTRVLHNQRARFLGGMQKYWICSRGMVVSIHVGVCVCMCKDAEILYCICNRGTSTCMCVYVYVCVRMQKYWICSRGMVVSIHVLMCVCVCMHCKVYIQSLQETTRALCTIRERDFSLGCRDTGFATEVRLHVCVCMFMYV